MWRLSSADAKSFAGLARVAGPGNPPNPSRTTSVSSARCHAQSTGTSMARRAREPSARRITWRTESRSERCPLRAVSSSSLDTYPDRRRTPPRERGPNLSAAFLCKSKSVLGPEVLGQIATDQVIVSTELFLRFFGRSEITHHFSGPVFDLFHSPAKLSPGQVIKIGAIEQTVSDAPVEALIRSCPTRRIDVIKTRRYPVRSLVLP